MNTINFGYTGGFPFEQHTFSKMQSAYIDVLVSLLGFLKVPPTGNHVLHGCQVLGGNITAGMMYIDGDLCSFAGVAGTSATKIKKIETITTAAFQNGSNNPVYRQTTAMVDETGVALSAFTRYGDQLVFDPNYVHTDNNFTATLLSKLNGIEPGAEVNVQADWNVVNSASDAFIKNKPTILNVLHKGTYLNMGDIANNDFVVAIPNVGTTNYSVFVSFDSPAGNAGQSASYFYVIHSKTTTSFTIRMNEVGNVAQSLSMNYLVIQN